MPLPQTPQELWSRILTLLKHNGGYATHQDVEEILGLHFTELEKDGEERALGAPYFYSMQQEVPGLGLVKMGLFEDPKRARLSLDWGPEFGELPNCLDLGQATRDLDALGWQAGNRLDKPGRNGLSFFSKADIAESHRTGKRLDISGGTSNLYLNMPNQYSQCVNGFTVSIWLP